MRYSATILFSLLLTTSACTPPGPEARQGQEALSQSTTGKTATMERIAANSLAAGDLGGAEELYRQLAADPANGVEPKRQLARIYRLQQKHDAAIALLQEAQREAPSDASLLVEMGFAQNSMNKALEAIASFDKALAIDGQNTSAMNGKGVALDKLSQHAQAQQIYRKALELDAGSSAIQNNLALSYILNNQYDEAIRILEPMASDPAARATIRHNLALAYGLKGDSERAMEVGLKDLSADEAKQNLKFYDYYTRSQRVTAPAQKAAPVAAVTQMQEPVKNIEPPAAIVDDTPAEPVVIQENSPSVDAESGKAKDEPSPTPATSKEVVLHRNELNTASSSTKTSDTTEKEKESAEAPADASAATDEAVIHEIPSDEEGNTTPPDDTEAKPDAESAKP